MAKVKAYTPHAVNAYGTDLGIVYYGELGLPEQVAERYLKDKTEILVQVSGDKTVRAQVVEKLGDLNPEEGIQMVRFEAREGFWSELGT